MSDDKLPEDRPEVVALAEAWASIDGKLEKFEDERRIVGGPFAKSAITKDGHYLGYLYEAEEMIERLRARGFDVTPVRTAPVLSVVPLQTAAKSHNDMVIARIVGVPAQSGGDVENNSACTNTNADGKLSP